MLTKKIKEDKMEEENVKREASYGTIRLSRAQIGGGGQFFFGSKVRVTNSILIEINNAEIVTDHGEQRVRDAGGAPLIRVELTPLQFSELLMSADRYEGVPCTITRHPIYGSVKYVREGIKTDADLAEEAFKKSVGRLKNTLTKDAVNVVNDSKLCKRDKERVLSVLNTVERNLTANSEYNLKCLREATERTLMEAKAEMEGYIQNRCKQLGLENPYEKEAIE
jgi:hypothetical protein